MKDNRRKLRELTTALSNSTKRLKLVIDKHGEALSDPEHLKAILGLERCVLFCIIVHCDLLIRRNYYPVNSDLQILLPRVKRLSDGMHMSNSISSLFGAWVKSGAIESEIASLEKRVDRCYQQFYVSDHYNPPNK